MLLDVCALQSRYGLTTYRGVPLPFFDLMIYPGGAFRPIDKKHYFNNRDRTFLDRKEADILLIGTGYRELGGQGFPHPKGSRFVYNPITTRGCQVILLGSADACVYYNRLRKAGKRVLFVLHTTC